MAYRILHLVHSHQRRGAEVFAVQLASQIQTNGLFQNGLCSIYRGSGSLPESGIPGFCLEGQVGGLAARIGLDPRIFYKLHRVMKGFRPDIVIAHGSSTLKYAAVAGSFYRRSTTIYRNIGTASSWTASPARTGLYKLVLRSVHSVVSVSQRTREDFIRLYQFPPERITYIRNGVDTSAFDARREQSDRREVRAELGLSQGGTVLVAVGNLSEEKGHRHLINLMANLQSAGLETRLLLVGDGPLQLDLEQQAAALGVSNQINFLGVQSNVPRILAAADLLVLPSKTEGMPAVLIEAGLAGLASVAFDVGGVDEVVEHNITGLLAPPGDLPKLTEAVIGLCGDAGRRAAMGIAARQRCRELFGINNVARQYEELLMGILCGDSKLSGGTAQKQAS